MKPNMKPLRTSLLVLLLCTATWAQALVLAVNEGVSYRAGSEDIRNRYAAIAADISKMLNQPVRVEPVGDYQELRKGLADKRFDLALVNVIPAEIEPDLPALADALRPGAVALFSGILSAAADDSRARLAAFGFREKARRTAGEWIAFATELAP